MATPITMPKLGLTMNSGSVQEWKKNIGDVVAKGEILFVVATDKLTVDVESPEAGVLLAITVQIGEDVPVGAAIGLIGEKGESAAAADATAPVAQAAPASSAAASAPAAAVQRTAAGAAGGHIAASPKAKKLAREKGVDLAALQGTGPNGWIVARDVVAAPVVKVSPVAAKMAREAGIDLASLDAGKRIMKADVAAAIARTATPGATGGGERRVPITQMRRIIGERMLTSVTTTPTVNYFIDVDMTALNALRADCNKRLAKENPDIKVSINDILMKLCAKLLLENPMLNASVGADAFILHDFVNIGFAVALPGGLLVPNIKDVQAKNLKDIALERADLVARTRKGALLPEEMAGGTFTISNLGMMGVNAFTPIINPPEAAILGVGATREMPVVCNGAVVVRPVATLCLTADHRLADGADAAAFLSSLKELVENPGFFLL